MSDCNDVDNIAGNSAKSNNDQLVCLARSTDHPNGKKKSPNGIVRRSVSSIIPMMAVEASSSHESLHKASNHTFDLHNLASSYHSLEFAGVGQHEIFEHANHNVGQIGANGWTDANCFSEPPTVSSSEPEAKVIQAHSSTEINYDIKPCTVSSSSQNVELIQTHSFTSMQNILKLRNVSSSDHDVELIPARSFTDVFDPHTASSNNHSVELIRAHSSTDTQDILKPYDLSYRPSNSNVESMPGQALSKQHYLISSNNKDELVQPVSCTDANNVSEACSNLSAGNTDIELVEGGILTDGQVIPVLDRPIASSTNNPAVLVQEHSFTEEHNNSQPGSNLSFSNTELELVEGDIITESDSDETFVQPCSYSRKYEEKWVGPESIIDTSHMSELGNVRFVYEYDSFAWIEEISFQEEHHISELGNRSLRNNQVQLVQESSFTDSIGISERASDPSVGNIEVELVKGGVLAHVHGISDLENASFSSAQVEHVPEDSLTDASPSELGRASFSSNQAELIRYDSFTDAYNMELGSASFSSNEVMLVQEDSVTDAYDTGLGSTPFSSNQIMSGQANSLIDVSRSVNPSSRNNKDELVGLHTNNKSIACVVVEPSYPSSSNNKDELVGLQTNNTSIACVVVEPSYPSTSNNEVEMAQLQCAAADRFDRNQGRNANVQLLRAISWPNVFVSNLTFGNVVDPAHREPPRCRFCQLRDERETLIAPCDCRGTLAYIHPSCLTRYLNQAERSTCQLCGYRFHTVETRRYSLCQSLAIWTRHPRNRPHVATIVITTLLLTTCAAGIMGVMRLADSGPWASNRPLCAFVVILVVSVYFVALTLLLKDQFGPWYAWWNRCVHVTVIIDPDTWRARTLGPMMATFQAGTCSNSSSDS